MVSQTKRASAPVLILAACVLYMISGGIRANFGIMVQAISERSSVSYADVSFAVAVGQLMYGASQPLFGILALKKSNAFVLILGTLLMVSGLLLTPLSHSLPALCMTIGLLFYTGTGAVCFGIIMGTISPLLGEKRASAASGILNASSSVGGALLSPVMQALQSAFGVGTLLAALALPCLILIPVVLWISHLSQGQRKEATAAPADTRGQLRMAVRDPDYRCLMIGFGTCGFHMCIIQTHLFSQLVSYGIAEQVSSLAYTVFGLTGIAGSVLCGFLCQRLPLRNVLGTLYGIRALIVPVFLFLLPKSPFAVFLFITVLGMTGDATVTPTSEVVSRRFGPESLGLLFGITYLCHQVGGFLSSWLGGVFITGRGNYQAVWLIDIALCLIASLASFRIRREITPLR